MRGPANQVRGLERAGGWLDLTGSRLRFRPHRLNLQRREWSVPIAEILDARPAPTAWIIPNGLLVETTAGPERFMVNDRADWVRAIRRQAESGRGVGSGSSPSPS